jgi:hypothetical protein
VSKAAEQRYLRDIVDSYDDKDAQGTPENLSLLQKRLKLHFFATGRFCRPSLRWRVRQALLILKVGNTFGQPITAFQNAKRPANQKLLRRKAMMKFLASHVASSSLFVWK